MLFYLAAASPQQPRMRETQTRVFNASKQPDARGTHDSGHTTVSTFVLSHVPATYMSPPECGLRDEPHLVHLSSMTSQSLRHPVNRPETSQTLIEPQPPGRLVNDVP
ncbi:hypothetical protein FSOLCH5_012791 [Fusarium solani]